MPNLPDLIGAFNNFRSSLPGIYDLIWSIAYLSSVYFTMAGILAFRHVGDHNHRHQGLPGVRGPLTYILIGAFLGVMPTTMESVSATIFCGSGSCGQVANPLDYETGSATGGYLIGLRQFIQLVGVISFMRGLFVLKNVGVFGERGKDTFWRGVTFIGAGVAGVHIVLVLQALALTFGFKIITTLVNGMMG